MLTVAELQQSVLRRAWRLQAAFDGPALMLWAGLIAAAFVALTGAVLWDAHQDVTREAITSAGNLISVIARDIEGRVQGFDTALQTVDATLLMQGTDRPSIGAPPSAVFESAGAARFQGTILVTDAAGRVIADSRTDHPNPESFTDLDIPNRDYFTMQRDGTVHGLYLGRPFKSRLSGKYSISLSRRLTTPDGHFDGVLVAGLDLDFFQSAANQLQLGRQAAISLIRADGVLLMHEPFDAKLIGADWSMRSLFSQYPAQRTGSLRTAGSMDGVGRLVTYGQVGSLPLVISVALSMQDVYTQWNRRAFLIGGIVLALVAAMLVTVRRVQRELAKRKAAEQLARENGARFRQLTESSRDTILRLKLDGTLRYVSPAIEEMLGYLPSEFAGASGHALIDPRDIHVVERALGRLRSGADHVTATYRCKRKDGSEVWVESLFRLIRDPLTNDPAEAIASCRDVTRRIMAEAELALSASTDGLTGLANRRRFDEALTMEWRRAYRENSFIALMMIDADSFKLFNDHFGHQEGDGVLQMVARCIAQTIRRPGDLGARYGGEEFAVVMPNTDEAGARVIAERIRNAVSGFAVPHPGGPAGHVTVSIGVAASLVFDGDSAAQLLRATDLALYRAKAQGRNRVIMASDMAAELEGGEPIMAPQRSAPPPGLTIAPLTLVPQSSAANG